MNLYGGSVARRLVAGHARINVELERSQGELVRRQRLRDDRGDVTPRTVGIAVMATLALTVGEIIRRKVIAKASSIPLD